MKYDANQILRGEVDPKEQLLWAADVPGYSAYLSIRSFGLEENGTTI
jgi:hypothetical protein